MLDKAPYQMSQCLAWIVQKRRAGVLKQLELDHCIRLGRSVYRQRAASGRAANAVSIAVGKHHWIANNILAPHIQAHN